MPNEYGIIRVACSTPGIKLANPEYNCEEIIKLARKAESKGAGIICFPEGALCGNTLGDLIYQETLYKANIAAIEKLKNASRDFEAVIVFGSYLKIKHRIVNVAFVLQRGEILGVVPSEKSTGIDEESTLEVAGENITFSRHCFTDKSTGAVFVVQSGNVFPNISEKFFSACCAGANIVINLTATPASYGTFEMNKSIAVANSMPALVAICTADAGPGESVSDNVYLGGSFIVQNGKVISECETLSMESTIIYGDIDVKILDYERMRSDTFKEIIEKTSYYIYAPDEKEIGPIPTLNLEEHSLLSIYDKHPYVPSDKMDLANKCKTVFKIQATGLARRISQIGCRKLVLGISGGLDSTLALLVCDEALRLLGRPSKDILAVTMPGFGTSATTFGNSHSLMELLDTDSMEISITEAVSRHFSDIKHNPEEHDVTYENAQARERTQILMDLSNKHGGIVVGTGDLSEAALGWCTYNGDHMAMYNVNSSVPKTFIKHILEWYMEDRLQGSENYSKNDKKLCEVLMSIIDTPISPELLPVDEKTAEMTQKTEEKIGPYELHDFFIHSFMHYGLDPEKLMAIAEIVFKDSYSRDEISKCLEIFYRRFFTQQFKRNCSPDGAGTDRVSLSPRNGLKIPSDVDFSMWLKDFK